MPDSEGMLSQRWLRLTLAVVAVVIACQLLFLIQHHAEMEAVRRSAQYKAVQAQDVGPVFGHVDDTRSKPPTMFYRPSK